MGLGVVYEPKFIKANKIWNWLELDHKKGTYFIYRPQLPNWTWITTFKELQNLR
jgi:hypothetical protein